MNRFKTFCFVLMSLLAFVCQAADVRKELIVSNQSQFDALDATVKACLKQGATDITVTLRKGVYYYGEKHLDFSGLDYPMAKVTLVGEEATLVAKDLGRERSWQDGAFDLLTLSDVDGWTALAQSPADVDVVDVKSKLCRIRVAKRQRRQNQVQCRGQYLKLTMWYDSKVYPVVRRDSYYIYFTATDLEYSEQFRHWNVNYDQMYGRVNPRYCVFLPDALPSRVRCCQASTFVNLWHSSMAGFTMRGISFGPNNGGAPLIATDMFRSRRLLVEQCRFWGVRGMVLKVWFTDNVEVRANTFEGCYHSGVESFNGSRNTQVVGNTFRNHGKGMRQNFGIVCRGEDFLVKDNLFRNFSYAAIGAGVWYGHSHQGPITGIVSGNDIAFEPDYYRDYLRHTLMDGGAIYTWTLCDKVAITGNRIDHYRGVKDYRGIFCDDGGKNLTISHNTVTNIGDDCWCIDLRWEDNVQKQVPDHNTGNVVRDNKVEGRVRFETSRPLTR